MGGCWVVTFEFEVGDGLLTFILMLKSCGVEGGVGCASHYNISSGPFWVLRLILEMDQDLSLTTFHCQIIRYIHISIYLINLSLRLIVLCSFRFGFLCLFLLFPLFPFFPFSPLFVFFDFWWCFFFTERVLPKECNFHHFSGVIKYYKVQYGGKVCH